MPEFLVVSSYLGSSAELGQSGHVLFGQGSKDDAIAAQLHDIRVTPTALRWRNGEVSRPGPRLSGRTSVKKRLDILLVERGLAESRTQAQALILAGLVRGHEKPGDQVDEGAELTVAVPPRYVSRGGEKLGNALAVVEIELDGRDCLDLGASTGGFTDALLQHGAGRVIAVDVGYGQLHPKLRNDPRVVVWERTNARDLDALPFQPDLLVCDVSFISVRLVLPPALRLLESGWDALVLVKPQFEAGRADVKKGGVVRDPEIHRRVLRTTIEAALDWEAMAIAVVDSGLPGPKGNREFFVHFIHRDEAELLNDIDDRIDAALG